MLNTFFAASIIHCAAFFTWDTAHFIESFTHVIVFIANFNRVPTIATRVTPTNSFNAARGAATDSGPPGQHIHSGPPAFRGGGGVIYYRNRDCVPEPVFFSPSLKSDYTVSAIKIVQFCM